jgi:hypothetical protein
MRPEPADTLAGPWGSAFPLCTVIGARQSGSTIAISVSTGALRTATTIPALRWSNAPAEHAANWRAWDLLFWRHWWRLAHDRGGYA